VDREPSTLTLRKINVATSTIRSNRRHQRGIFVV
jgi:hypothetical protein